MKNSGMCPKCGSTDIIKVLNRNGWDFITSSWLLGLGANVRLARYLCGKCGFSEEWAQSADDIEEIRASYPNA